MWAKRHTKHLVSLSDLAPNLPRSIEEVMLKAMAKDPSQRYANIPHFLRALEIASPLPPSALSSRPPVAPSSNMLVSTVTEPLENRESEVSLAMRPVEHTKHVDNRYNDSKTPVRSARDSDAGSFPAGRRSRPDVPLTPIVWLAFALSGIIILIGTLILYALIPLHLPASPQPRKSNLTAKPTVLISKHPTVPFSSQTPMPTTLIPTPTVSQSSNLHGELLNRSGWTASASLPNDLPSDALDGNTTALWSSGQSQTNGQWFLVDMGSLHSFTKITLDTGSNNNGDYPRGYQVFVSNDGSNWGNAIVSGNGTEQLVTISFAAQSARFIKVVLTASASNWWSIYQFNVYDASGALNRSGWTASAFSSNLVPSNALDGNTDTHWSTARGTDQWTVVPGRYGFSIQF